MIEASALVSFLIWIIVIGCVFWLLFWLIGYVGLPEPFAKIARVILAVVAVLLLINFLLGMTGATPLLKLR